MNPKFLSNRQLNQNMLELAGQERALLAEVLMCIKEIDSRKLYALMAYGSLFDYLTKHCGYSPGSAQRRIDAARLLCDVPEVAEKIESGELTLSQVSHVQKALRQLKKESKSVSREQKQELVLSLSGLSEAETQYQVAKVLELEIKETSKVNHQADKSVRIELTLTDEQWNLLKQAQQVLSHQVPDGDLSDVITKMSELVIKQKRAVRQTCTATALPAKRHTSTLTLKTKKIVLQKHKCCVYTDPVTKKQCGSRWQLEVDHIQPQWAHGTHEENNLQVLCRTHNNYKYKQHAGLI